MLRVVKIGGAVIDAPQALNQFLDDFSRLDGPKVLVHGGGRAATALSKKLEMPAQMVEGRRITDADTLRVVTMVYAGEINKGIVAQLQARGCNAMGLCGADANVVRAHKRPPSPVDYGYVGDIESVDAKMLQSLMSLGITPVLCAITHDGAGQLLNTNADTVASAVAVGLSALEPVELVYCFEQLGVMRDVADPDSWIPEICKESYERLKKEGVISGGMIPKLDNAFKAISAGVCAVVIKQAQNLLKETGSTIKA